MKNIIVITAHPDDETLGCGGTLLKHKNNGDKLFWLIITKGYTNQGFSQKQLENREKEIDKVANIYGFDDVFQLDYPTMSLDNSSLNTLIPEISNIFKQVEPNIIYVMNRSDAHSDHRITFESVMACTKSFRYPFIKKVLMYECISETEFAPNLPERAFLPNYFVDITDYLDGKIKIMEIYSSELGIHPFPRSKENIKALATYRGATAGIKYAEAFQLILQIDK